MPKKKRSSRKEKQTAVKRVVRRTVSAPVALGTSRSIRRRVVKVQAPAPTVDTFVTETDIVKEPKVEIRRPATLSQALTERAEIVVKPQTKVITRVVKAKRGKRAA
jgi:hypothetical protein